MKRKAEEFRNNAIKYQIESWMFRKCSLCGHPIGFLFLLGMDEVYFDGGCICARLHLQPRTWEDVAELYNCQENPEIVREFDRFWHFSK